MSTDNIYDVAIIGGGLAGLTLAIRLSRAGKSVIVFEKHDYPQQKVCGEYVSAEVTDILADLGFDPFSFGAARIDRLVLSDLKGTEYRSELPMGGIGISRACMDGELYRLAQKNGAIVKTRCNVFGLEKDGYFHVINCSEGRVKSKLVVGCHGKRSSVDRAVQRSFVKRRTRFMGVKYHARLDFPGDTIALHSFRGGYCGIVAVEKGLYNICYLFRRPEEEHLSPAEIEEKYVFSNPLLKDVFAQFRNAESSPLVINEIYFGEKEKADGDMIFCGDAAGLITPLCGNGMAIAIHSAVILADCILNGDDFEQISKSYQKKWSDTFALRLKSGRWLQHLFLNPLLNKVSLKMIYAVKGLDRFVIAQTHGKERIDV